MRQWWCPRPRVDAANMSLLFSTLFQTISTCPLFFQTIPQARARFRVKIRSEEVCDVLAPSDRDPGELSTYQTRQNNDAWKINIKLIKTLIKPFRAIIL